MKLWDIVKNVGSAALQVALPGTGSAIVAGVNAFLDDDEKLPETATGDQVKSAIDRLPPEQRQQVMQKEYDVKIEELQQAGSTLRAMLEADFKTPHSTRPYIAKGAFHVLAFVMVAVISLFCYAIAAENSKMVNTVVEGWPFILSVIGPFVVLLRSYFGVLRQEHKKRLDAAQGQSTPDGLAAIIGQLFNRKG